jgi:hypothetical protein
VSPWYASNNILLHGDDNYVWTYNNIVEIYWGNLVSEFGNNIWKKLSDYTCCKQMETKGISMIYRPAPQQAYLCLIGILSKASCFMELANSLDIEWSMKTFCLI